MTIDAGFDGGVNSLYALGYSRYRARLLILRNPAS